MGSQGKTIPCCRLRNYVTKQSKEKVVRKYLAHSRPIEFTIRFQHCTNTAPTFHERCCANVGSFCSNRRRDYVKQKKKKSTQKSSKIWIRYSIRGSKHRETLKALRLASRCVEPLMKHSRSFLMLLQTGRKV